MISTASMGQVLGAIGRSRRVLLAASLLGPGKLLNALEAAARRGARVTVRIEGRPYAGSRPEAAARLAERNARSVRALREAGADASVVDARKGQGPPLHLKGAVCDGVAYLDERNWPLTGADTIVRDTRARDIAALRAALLQRHARAGEDFWTSQSRALAAETRLLTASHHAQVDVESESFGYGDTYAALKRLASEGVHCRLLVDERALTARARAALEHLHADGVQVRTGEFDEKMAIADASRAWLGSANATFGYPGQFDWGLRTDAPGLVRVLQAHFDDHWNASKALA